MIQFSATFFLCKGKAVVIKHKKAPRFSGALGKTRLKVFEKVFGIVDLIVHRRKVVAGLVQIPRFFIEVSDRLGIGFLAGLNPLVNAVGRLTSVAGIVI